MSSLISLVSAVLCLGGFTYAVLRSAGKRYPLYMWFLFFGVGCFGLEPLFQFVLSICGEISESGYPFNLSYVGYFGSFLFFFSANFGVMNHMLDDGNACFRKYRIISCLAPALIALAVICVTLQSSAAVWALIITGIAVAASSYYNLKFFIFPDMDFSFAKVIKLPNLFCLCLGFVLIIQQMIDVLAPLSTIPPYLEILCGVICILIAITTERGCRLWRV